MRKIEIQTAAGSRRSSDACSAAWPGTCVYLESPDGALFAFPPRLGEESRALRGADGDISRGKQSCRLFAKKKKKAGGVAATPV